MSDTSRPQRIEGLESSVGDIKTKLSKTKAQIEQMVGMMQQLLQTKSGSGGQQEQRSGGSGRRDANTKAAAPEGQRAKKGPLAQGLVPRQKLLQGGKIPTTATKRRMDQDLLTTQVGDQRFQLA